MGKKFAQKWKLGTTKTCGRVELADGRKSSSEATMSKPLNLRIGEHKERMQLTITELKSGYDVLLGIPWLEDHNPAITWKTRELLLTCNKHRVVVRGEQLHRTTAAPRIQMVSLDKMMNHIGKKGTESILFLIREKQVTGPDLGGDIREVSSIVPGDADLQDLLSEYKDVLVQGLPPGLPAKRSIDHRIELLPGESATPHRPCYRTSPLELEESRRQVEELLDKGYMRPSVSPYGVPILFSRKKNDELLENLS